MEENREELIDNFKENILDFFGKRISKILFIKDFAVENKISYSQAKKIYNQRYSEKSQTIRKLARIHQVPYELIISMVDDDNLSFKQIDYDSINDKILNEYADKMNKHLLLIKDYSIYIDEIRKRLINHTHKSIADVIKEIERDIIKFSKNNNVSIAIALLCVCSNYKIEEAKDIIDFLTYNEINNIDNDKDLNISYANYLNNCKELKRTSLYGITIVSRNEEQLNILERIVKYAFLYGNDEYKKQLQKLSKEKNLILTSIIYYGKDKFNAFFDEYNIIYMDVDHDKLYQKASEEDYIDSFYHETSHFIDYQTAMNQNYYYTIDEKIWDFSEKIREKINREPYKDIINNQNIPRMIRSMFTTYSNTFNKGFLKKGSEYKKNTVDRLADKYIHDPTFEEKWKKEIEEEYKPESEDELKEYLLEKKIYERDKYLRLIGCVYDIYDGILGGNLHDKYHMSGHGREYYSNYKNLLTESIAEIGVLYNNDCMDVLNYELGEELTKELIEIYSEVLQKSKEINEKKQEVDLNEMLVVSQSENSETVDGQGIKRVS